MKETEKAICLKMLCEFCGGHKDGDSSKIDIWVPKSLVIDNTIPFWFIENKRREKGLRNLYCYNPL